MNDFRTKFLSFVKDDSREISIEKEKVKHVIDEYDKESKLGIKFQSSKISTDEVKSKDSIAALDWIFNVENEYVKTVIIGSLIICEIPHKNWEEAVKVVKDNVFLYTGYSNWIWLTDKNNYKIEIESKIRNVWIGKKCSFKTILDNTCLESIITDEGIGYFKCITKKHNSVNIIYGRCTKSMDLLDNIHRKFVNKYKFRKNKIIAIKSVAGSGKTTTLLNLSKTNIDKKILYVAFNKSLITEIKEKIKIQKITNMFPCTFDALLYKLYIERHNIEPCITSLRPHFIGKVIPFLDGKPFKIKDYYCKKLTQFCNTTEYTDIKLFCEKELGGKKPLLEQMWDKVKQNKLITFETIRKQSYINGWFKTFIDKNYDVVMIDETQDFDMIMLKMLLNDTTIPKIFVGDPKQSIYKFRGCINAFNYLPVDTLIIEFYSTFRIGNPACETIRNEFDDCWMISKSKNKTTFVNSFDIHEKYVYLFRSWRVLLQTAEKTNNIWIYNYEKKFSEITNLHKKLSYSKLSDEDMFEDDLPKFLKSITLNQLEELIDNIANNIVSFEDSEIQFYTTHSYKGMENNNIRLAKDINVKKDENIYYVSITRSMKKILIDY